MGGNKQISLIIHSPCGDVWIIRVWAMHSKGLFCPTGVKCNFPLYRVTEEGASKVVCSIGSHSHFVLMAIWHSTITAQWPSQPYNIKILYFANANWANHICSPSPSCQGRFLVSFSCQIIHIMVTFWGLQTFRVSLMVIYLVGCMQAC